MPAYDHHSFANLTQGMITHIDFHIQADFETHILKVHADYQFEGPVNGSLFLDTDDIDLKGGNAKGKEVQWDLDERDEILGA